MTSPPRWNHPRPFLIGYGLLGSLSLLWVVLDFLSVESEPGRSVLFGLSPQRLALAAVSLMAVTLLAVLSVMAWRSRDWAERFWNRFVLGPEAVAGRRLIFLAFALGWIVLFTPPDRLGGFSAYIAQAEYFVAWLVLFSGVTFLMLLPGKHGIRRAEISQALRSRASAFPVILSAVMAAIAVLALGRIFSLFRPEDYTYGAGVPVLASQVLLALGAAVLIEYFAPAAFFERVRRPDLIIALAIWALTALLWIREPAPSSYFNPGPYPPNHEYYPFSDAATYDLGSQYALIGQGLNDGAAFDRPLYMQFLLILHLFAGQEYALLANLQSLILAFFPVLLYLVGKEIAGRGFGAGLGLLGALRGLNSIAGASLIDLGSQKQLLTDFPTGLGVAALLYLAVKWLKHPEENRLFVVWAGGTLGLLSLIRTNAVLLFIPLVILVLIVHRRKLTRALANSFALLAIMIVVVLPWGLPSRTFMLETYLLKFRDVIQQRYVEPTSMPSPAPDAKLAALSQAAGPPGLGFIPRHYFHNLLSSFLILPASPYFHDLRSVVKEAFPYWRAAWDGAFAPAEAIFLGGQFILFALGLGMAWRRAGLAGAAPLVFFLTYLLANAMGRTAGGRYIVPVDWVVLLYYLLGLTEAVILVAEIAGRRSAVLAGAPEIPSDQFAWSRGLAGQASLVLGLFIVIGLTPTITAAFIPLRYPDGEPRRVLVRLTDAGDLATPGIEAQSVEVFLKEPSAALIYGRALYPRYYPGGAGEPDDNYPYRTLDYPRLAFTVIGSRGVDGVLLPVETLEYFPNASDVLVLGCQAEALNRKHVEALVVFVIEADQAAAVYTRQPGAALHCPVPAIECNDNRECSAAP